ncbi:MAG TPA: magnesium transporter CorA family protein, partial [Bryobacteraceae bacterium]|nr:magnesium transporter CorA family protein [Bryobacteraceae bacterium]
MEWHFIRDPQDPELDRLAERYGLHPLHIEDCRHRNQSAKIESNDGYLFMVLKPARVDKEGDVEVCDLDVFLGPGYIITVEEAEWPSIRELLNGLRPACAALRPDQAFYRITDAIVDAYLPPLDYLDDRIDNLEDEVLDNPTPDALARLFEIKRGLALLRRVLVNTRDVAGHLQRSESPLIGRDMWPFLRDIYDHVARNMDTVEMQRDLLNGVLDVYLSSVANRTNQVMKVLTVLGTIALPAIVIS